MLGALIMVLILIVILPATFMVSGAITAMVLGESLWRHGETRALDAELVERTD